MYFIIVLPKGEETGVFNPPIPIPGSLKVDPRGFVNIPVLPAPLAGVAPTPGKNPYRELDVEVWVGSCLHGQDLSCRAVGDLQGGVKGMSAGRSDSGSFQMTASALGPGAGEILCEPFKSESLFPPALWLFQRKFHWPSEPNILGAPLPRLGSPK